MIEINHHNRDEGGSEIPILHSKIAKGSIPYSRILLETMTVVQLVTKFLYFYLI
jgi:hypothetical protein